MTEIFYQLESLLDLRKFNFMRVDIALTMELEKSADEEKQALYIESDMFSRFSVTPNSILCSDKILNYSGNLNSIHTSKLKKGGRSTNSKLRLHPSSIERVNSYSCPIPVLWDRRIRNSNCCQATSRILYETMQRTIFPDRSQDKQKILKSLGYQRRNLFIMEKRHTHIGLK